MSDLIAYIQRELDGWAEIVDYLGTGPDRAHLFTLRNNRGHAMLATVRGQMGTGLTLSLEPL